MAEFRSDSLDELLANFEFARVKEYVERRDPGTADPGTAPTDETPVETAPAPSSRIGMFMPSSAPKLRGRKNLAEIIQPRVGRQLAARLAVPHEGAREGTRGHEDGYGNRFTLSGMACVEKDGGRNGR